MPTAKRLTDFERDVLRMLSGEKVDGVTYGAALMQAVEFLHGSGHVCRVMTSKGIEYAISQAGREAIAAIGK